MLAEQSSGMMLRRLHAGIQGIQVGQKPPDFIEDRESQRRVCEFAAAVPGVRFSEVSAGRQSRQPCSYPDILKRAWEHGIRLDRLFSGEGKPARGKTPKA